MSVAELRELAKLGPESAELLLRRMAVLDLDRKEVAQTQPQTFRDLQRICTMCESHRQCAHDLTARFEQPEVGRLLPERRHPEGAERAAVGVAARVVKPATSHLIRGHSTRLWALVGAALLLNGLVKIDTADGEKLGWNF